MVQIENELVTSASRGGVEAHAALPPRWSDDTLLAARQQADPVVDALVQKVFEPRGNGSLEGRLAYNHLLDIADKLLESPELTLIRSSTVAQQLSAYPPQLVRYFEPMPAPDWVDSAKLALASQLWNDNMLAILGVLYAASLPSCYLIRNGIPALYQSSKLKEHRYIYQRLYETGLFLDDLMSPGGIRIISDIDAHHIGPDHLITALNRLDTEGGWVRQGQTLVRTQASAQPPLDPDQVKAMAGQLSAQPRRYLWGKGYIAAKKVRFLHATMRYMLTHPNGAAAYAAAHEAPATIAESLAQPTTPWKTETWGQPVNQEDLAYTLLTFAYLIPCALERWGCRWTQAEKEAFLHLWKTAGYLLGVHPTLLTDVWDEAERLFVILRHQQAGPSEAGKRLTDALIRFLQDYLPPILAQHVPPILIRSQLGTHYAAMLFTPEQLRMTQSVVARLNFGLFLGLIRLYYLVCNPIFRRSATLAAYMGRVFSQAGDALINSWRDAYARRPFYVPADASTWKRVQGVQVDFMAHLHTWRRQLFSTVAAGLGCLLSATFCLVLAMVLWLCERDRGAETAAWLALGSLVTALGIFKAGVPYISRKRPKLSQ
jgi:ER-bound oxygenase mpaB/B'/Rubber oxygenase, catalytic domain